jgi:hypothetical protein
MVTSPHAPGQRHAKGFLPSVSGRNLKRKSMHFPRDFAGDINLVFIAFQQWHQAHVDSWVPFVEELSREFPHLHYYEFPTIQTMNRLAQTFINEGMRAGIRDEATRARTVTLYIDKEPFRNRLAIPDEEDIWVILFSPEGEILWRVAGRFTPEKGAALRATVANVAEMPANA